MLLLCVAPLLGQPSPNGPSLTSSFDTIVNIHISDLLPLQEDANLNGEWNARLGLQTLLETPEYGSIVHQMYMLPWPLMPRDLLMQVRWARRREHTAQQQPTARSDRTFPARARWRASRHRLQHAALPDARVLPDPAQPAHSWCSASARSTASAGWSPPGAAPSATPLGRLVWTPFAWRLWDRSGRWRRCREGGRTSG